MFRVARAPRPPCFAPRGIQSLNGPPEAEFFWSVSGEAPDTAGGAPGLPGTLAATVSMNDYIKNQFGLSGKTALVTGCKRGIGQAMAVALAEAGADIIGVSATLEPGGETEKFVTSLGRQFIPFACDFKNRSA